MEFKPFEKVLVRINEADKWSINLFSHTIDVGYGEIHYTCVDGTYKFCIPYIGNEDLVGTTNKPKEVWKPKYKELALFSDDKVTWSPFFYLSGGETTFYRCARYIGSDGIFRDEYSWAFAKPYNQKDK